ncbi:MAG: M28 family peptidase [Bacteroidales bacterium]|jgi:hypothetical protein
MTKYKTLYTIILIISSINLFSQVREADEKNVRSNLTYMSSDKLKGREPGTKEDKITAQFIASKLETYGLKPLIGNDPLVPFQFTLYREKKGRASIKIGRTTLNEGEDFSVLPISPSADITGSLIFGENEIGDAVADLKGKVVVIKTTIDSIPFKVTALRDKGAVAVLFYSNEILNLETRTENKGISLPVAQISLQTVKRISAMQGERVRYKAVIHIVKGTSYNVVMHTGQQNLSNESILIGAHYDHLGYGGMGSSSMSQGKKEIHNGADDNASGVAAAMEIGRLLAENRSNLKKDIIIAAFGGEERGLLGSKVVADTLKKLSLTPTLMINLDMVGRLSDNKLQVGGTGTFSEADSVIHKNNKYFKFNLAVTREGNGPSDHSSFYSTEVPVLYFTTGVHKQYHTPQDDVELINFPGMVAEINYISSIINELASNSYKPEFIKTASPSSPARANFKVTLGLIPDFTYEVGDGFKVGPVTDGKPAQKGGMLSGDIITAINEKKISNIYEYMSRLGELKAGDIIQVDIRREGQAMKLTIKL